MGGEESNNPQGWSVEMEHLVSGWCQESEELGVLIPGKSYWLVGLSC